MTVQCCDNCFFKARGYTFACPEQGKMDKWCRYWKAANGGKYEPPENAKELLRKKKLYQFPTKSGGVAIAISTSADAAYDRLKRLDVDLGSKKRCLVFAEGEAPVAWRAARANNGWFYRGKKLPFPDLPKTKRHTAELRKRMEQAGVIKSKAPVEPVDPIQLCLNCTRQDCDGDDGGCKEYRKAEALWTKRNKNDTNV